MAADRGADLRAEIVSRARSWAQGRELVVRHEYLETCRCGGCSLVTACRALEALEAAAVAA